MSLGQRATLDPTVFVAPGAVVLGEVTLAARSSVWFNTVIRGDSAAVVVGEDTNVQDNTVVHEDEGFPARIGSRVTIGHRAIIHGCVIEDDCLIGMGSVVLTGARIGHGSLIGAASLVRERQAIPPDSLVVGSPARVVGSTSEAHRAAIRNGWSHYAELARSYMKGGLARGADPSGAVTRDRGPVTSREWTDLLARFEAAPGELAARAVDDRPSPAAVHALAAQDRIVRLPLIEAVLRDPAAPLMSEVAEQQQAIGSAPAEQAFGAWRSARASLLAQLRRLGPADWIRPIGHPTRGARTVGDWLREWVDDDADRARALSVSERRA